MTELLRIEGLEAGYGRIRILHGVSIATTGNNNVGLFGPNGHGKTTLLRTISGLIRASSGTIRFDGTEIGRMAPRAHRRTRARAGAAGQPAVPGPDDPRNAAPRRLAVARPRRGIRAMSIAWWRYSQSFGERWSQQVRTLSGGERQMVSIGVALMSHPRLLLLDEPTLGLAPRLKDELCAAIRRISDDGVKLVVVEQDVEFLLDLAEHLYLVNHGEIATEIRPGEMMDHAAIMEMYFGRQVGPLT